MSIAWEKGKLVMLDGSHAETLFRALNLKKLTLENIKYIDEILASLGEYGEAHLIVQRGELSYINKVESFKARKNKTHE